MSKVLKLDEKDALKLYPTASNEFKTLLEANFTKKFFNQKIYYKVTNIEELCEYLGIEEEELYIFPKNTKDKHQRYINACNIIPKIVECYNEGEPLDFKNTNVYKYTPYKYLSVGSWVVYFEGWYCCFNSPAGFYYKSSILSEKGYTNFSSIYEDFWDFK